MGIVQLIPGTQQLASANARLWEAFNHIAILPGTPRLSLAPDHTLECLAFLATCTLLLFLLTSMTYTSKRIKCVMLAVVSAALGNAILAFCQYFSHAAQSIGMDFHGAFLNRNHFAFLMLMGIITGLGLMASLLSEQRRFSHSLPYDYANREKHTSMLGVAVLAFVLFAMIAAQIISLSRGAFIGMTIAATCFIIIWLLLARHVPSEQKHKALALTATVGAALTIGLPVALNQLSQRYQQLEINELTLDSRWLVWQDAARLIRDFWTWGIGLGAFPHLIQRYESGNFTQQLVDHAHNDYLELAAEIGVPLTVCLLLLLIFLCWRTVRSVRTSHGTRKWAAVGAVLTILGVAIHEVVDFNLQAWPNALVFMAVLALLDASTRQPQPPLHTQRRGRFSFRLPCLVLAVLTLCAVPTLIHCVKAASASSELSAHLRQTDSDFRPQFTFQQRQELYQKARGHVLNRHRLLKHAATAKMLFAEHKLDHHFEHIQDACELIAEAARRAPADGITAIFLARFFDIGRTFELNDLPPSHLNQLYDWAAQCQPTLSATAEDAATAAFNNYLQTVANDEPEAVVQQARDKAIRDIQHCLTLSGASYGQLYNQLFQLCPDLSELLTYVPENTSSLLALLRVFHRQGHHHEALALIRRLQKQQSQLTPEEQLHLLTQKAWHLTLTEQSPRLPEVWNEYAQLLQNPYWEQPETKSSRQTDSLRHQIAKLQQLEATQPSSPARILKIAQLQRTQGHQIDTMRTLLKLTYLDENHPELTPQLLSKAQQCLGDPHLLGHDYFLPRALFLDVALEIMQARHTDMSEQLPHLIEQLEHIETKAVNWLQRHLIPLFRARAHILLKQPQQAQEALLTCLEICPDNALALLKLQQLAPDALSERQRQLCRLLISQTPHPIAQFHGGLDWLALTTTPQTVNAMHQQIQLQYTFVCRNDINEKLELDVVFQNQQNIIYFADRITFTHGQEHTLRVGEIVQIQRQWQPALLALDRLHRIPANGMVFAHCRKQGFPSPVAFAFKLKI